VVGGSSTVQPSASEGTSDRAVKASLPVPQANAGQYLWALPARFSPPQRMPSGAASFSPAVHRRAL